MHDLDPELSAPDPPRLDEDDELREPSDEELLAEEAALQDDLEAVEDEGFDISEFDEEDEGSLYGDDDELFIAGDEDLPDEPDDEDDAADDDEEDDDSWFDDDLN